MRKRLKTARNSAKKFRRSALIIVILATTSLAIGAAVTVISGQKASLKEESHNQEQRPLATRNRSYVTVKVAGQDVQVDSQTGQIKELTPEETKKLAAGLKQEINQSTDGLVQVQQPDGSVTMDIDGRFQNVTVARVNDDGTLSESCVDNPKAAGEFFGIDPQLIENPDSTPATKLQTRVTLAKNPNQ